MHRLKTFTTIAVAITAIDGPIMAMAIDGTITAMAIGPTVTMVIVAGGISRNAHT